MPSCIPPGIYSKAVEFKGRVDRWGDFEYVACCCILQFTGARSVGEGDYERDARGGVFGLRIFYGITPETEHTSWFIWSTANSYRQIPIAGRCLPMVCRGAPRAPITK
jgi:hypothetical protein